MSLPWFPFKIADYVKDTMRLSTEGHGCYLLLILDYYANEEPPPDDDDVLASICKLPVATWQQKHRKVLAPFFRIDGGFWHHDRIEKEILEATSKHNRAVDKAVKAAAAAVAQRSPSRSPQGKKRQNKPSSHLQGAAEEPSSVASGTEHKQEHIHPPSGGEEAPPARLASQGLGSPISKDWMPTMEARTAALAAAITDEEFGAEVRKFVGTKTADGAFSNDWDASFAVWIEREIGFREKRAKATAAKAPPRIEVNVAENWDAACEQWSKFRRWPRNHGADPESPACRAPPDVRAKHGIDERGNVVKVQA